MVEMIFDQEDMDFYVIYGKIISYYTMEIVSIGTKVHISTINLYLHHAKIENKDEMFVNLEVYIKIICQLKELILIL